MKFKPGDRIKSKIVFTPTKMEKISGKVQLIEYFSDIHNFDMKIVFENLRDGALYYYRDEDTFLISRKMKTCG